MGLPKLDQPVYRHKLTGLNKEVKFRAFTVKEQKILLHAKESNDPGEIIDAINQIISICVQDKIDVESLPYFDIEDLFLRIRAKSVSNVIELPYRVKDTDEKVIIKIDLDDVKVSSGEGHSNKIMITDTIGMLMTYPSLTMLKGTDDDGAILRACIKQIFTEDEVMNAADYSTEELNEFIDQFDIGTTKKIHDFFDTMPKIRHEVKVKLKGEEEETIKFEGINDLFT